MTPRQREILEILADPERKGCIFYVDGKKNQYPAICWRKQLQRITRTMVFNLERAGWIEEVFKYGYFTGSYNLTEAGRKAVTPPRSSR